MAKPLFIHNPTHTSKIKFIAMAGYLEMSYAELFEDMVKIYAGKTKFKISRGD